MDNEKIMKESLETIIENTKTFQFGENSDFSNLMNFAKHMESKIVIIPKKNEDQIKSRYGNCQHHKRRTEKDRRLLPLPQRKNR